MNKTSIPAFIENLTPDTANAKYSRAKLKMYYVGETVDHRLFTKEFSDKLISTIAYTPVVGFYSVADDDFVGHNNVQHIYGLVPADASVEYVEDETQQATFAVTDIILYTGRPDEIGTVASKIVGKQHSLELDPKTIQYKVNKDEFGNFRNLEFTDGELIGLSVLGDNETPAFTGSEFFSAEELPEFITDENRSKYQALFTTMFNVRPTAEEVIRELYQVLDSQRIHGYVCEHVADEYVVVDDGYYNYARYICGRDADNNLTLTLDCSVRPRFLSDAQIEALVNAEKGTPNVQTETNAFAGTEPTPSTDPAPSTEGGEPEPEPVAQATTLTDEEIEALRSNCSNLEEQIAALNNTINELNASIAQSASEANNFASFFRDTVLEAYALVLDADSMSGAQSIEDANELREYLNSTYKAVIEAREASVFEISTINTSGTSYNEYDEAAVVEKYKNMNRGKN